MNNNFEIECNLMYMQVITKFKLLTPIREQSVFLINLWKLMF